MLLKDATEQWKVSDASANWQRSVVPAGELNGEELLQVALTANHGYICKELSFHG